MKKLTLGMMILLSFIFVGCGSDSSDKSVEDTNNNSSISTNSSVSEKQTNKSTTPTPVVPSGIASEIAQVGENMREKVENIITEATETAKVKASEDVLASKTVNNTEITNSGKILYTKCVGCHGTNGEKVALGKSKIIKNMTKEQIVNALKGYQTGTYGGTMKGVMVGQVSGMTDSDIEQIADYIR